MTNEPQKLDELTPAITNKTGRERANTLLDLKSMWQADYYKDIPPWTPSRQYRRWLNRYTKAREVALLKQKTIATRRQKVAVKAT